MTDKKTIISYSFFVPKKLNEGMRTWDLYNGANRYWYNLPATFLANKIYYPHAKCVVHICDRTIAHSLYPILETLQEGGYLTLERMPDRYQSFANTEPTLWRYVPLFDQSADFVHCRDIDSVPTPTEARYTKYFERHDYSVGTMRTHTNHASWGTVFLAGLFSAVPKKLYQISGAEFADYYAVATKHGGEHWGLDQNMLIQVFGRNAEFTSAHMLDCKIETLGHPNIGPNVVPCVSITGEYLDGAISTDAPEGFDAVTAGICSWAGEPVDARGDKLVELCAAAGEHGRYILSSIEALPEHIRDFYLSKQNI